MRRTESVDGPAQCRMTIVALRQTSRCSLAAHCRMGLRPFAWSAPGLGTQSRFPAVPYPGLASRFPPQACLAACRGAVLRPWTQPPAGVRGSYSRSTGTTAGPKHGIRRTNRNQQSRGDPGRVERHWAPANRTGSRTDVIDTRRRSSIIGRSAPGWWNWQTRTVEGRMLHGMRVQIPPPA